MFQEYYKKRNIYKEVIKLAKKQDIKKTEKPVNYITKDKNDDTTIKEGTIKSSWHRQPYDDTNNITIKEDSQMSNDNLVEVIKEVLKILQRVTINDVGAQLDIERLLSQMEK